MQSTGAPRLGAPARLLGALLLLQCLGGCVAAAALAVPAMTGVGIATRKDADDAQPPRPSSPPARVVKQPAASPSPVPQLVQPQARAPAAAPAPALAPAPAAGATVRIDGQYEATILPLAELPKPGSDFAVPAAGEPWKAFIAYAVRQARSNARSDDERVSAILAPDSAVQMLPHRRACKGEDSAVIIDLDPAGGSFAPEVGLRAPPDIGGQLDLLRRQGTVIMWISDLDTSRLDDIARALVDSGLDPTGRDPILLAIGDGDRKQSLRQQAGRNACVVAMAGDERKDFDELFGYLRNPQAAANFDTMIGSGWFLVPAVSAGEKR